MLSSIRVLEASFTSSPYRRFRSSTSSPALTRHSARTTTGRPITTSIPTPCSSVLPITVRTPEEPSDVPSVAPQPAARRPHPAPRPAARRPLDLRVHAQRIQIDELIVTDPRTVLAHARTAAHHDPDTAALVGYSTTTPLTLPTGAALLCSLHDPDELADIGLRMVRHITRTTAATQHRDPVVLELSYAPEEAGR
ncbi:hypothetical protein [Streptomyces anulatus]|uniref:hypothetical protein n=1 Tax=Streptomyces anulatus TaxID=1892 RepID=UPI0038700B39|nr:hypothetical protein OG536_38140 [Streptomyces anulatus]